MAVKSFEVTGQDEARAAVRARKSERPVGSLAFDSLMVGALYWFVIGFYVDGWAHNHGQADATFFTPWHAMLYSGVLAVGTVLVITQVRNMSKGYSLLNALPEGYLPALIGTGLFFAAGLLDLVWHTLFGIEANIEALLSPTHLLLAGCGFLFIIAPFRAAWARPVSTGWKQLLPCILSLAAMLSQLTFFTQYANLVSRPLILISEPGPDTVYGIPGFTESAYGIFTILASITLIIGVILFAMRRWKLPFGAVTLMLTINTVLMIGLKWRYVSPVLPAMAAAPLGGLLIDILIWRLKPSLDRLTALRTIAFIGPGSIALVYLLLLNLVGQAALGSGLFWKVHMYLGVPFLAGCAGLLLSWLVIPPPLPWADLEQADLVRATV